MTFRKRIWKWHLLTSSHEIMSFQRITAFTFSKSEDNNIYVFIHYDYNVFIMFTMFSLRWQRFHLVYNIFITSTTFSFHPNFKSDAVVPLSAPQVGMCSFLGGWAVPWFPWPPRASVSSTIPPPRRKPWRQARRAWPGGAAPCRRRERPGQGGRQEAWLYQVQRCQRAPDGSPRAGDPLGEVEPNVHDLAAGRLVPGHRSPCPAPAPSQDGEEAAAPCDCQAQARCHPPPRSQGRAAASPARTGTLAVPLGSGHSAALNHQGGSLAFHAMVATKSSRQTRPASPPCPTTGRRQTWVLGGFSGTRQRAGGQHPHSCKSRTSSPQALANLARLYPSRWRGRPA